MSNSDESNEEKKSSRRKRTRGNRDGKPYKHKKGWCAKAYWPDGKIKYCYGKTAKDAAEKRKKFYAELEEGGPISVGNTTTLAQYLEKVWLAETLPQRVKLGLISPDTLNSYRDSCENHIIPDLGHIRIFELSTSHIRSWHLTMLKKRSKRTPKKTPEGSEPPQPPLLKRRTVVIHHTALRKALADAVADEIIKRNVAKLVSVPARIDELDEDDEQGQSSKPDRLTKEEAAQLLAASLKDRFWCYWLVVLGLGLRRGEGLGLRWSRVDFEENTVQPQRSVQRVRGDVKDESTGRRGGKLVAKRLKTKASATTIPAPALVMEALKKHKEEQDAERADAKVWVDEDLVFCTHLGTMLEPRNMNRAWHNVCDRSGIGRRVRIHDLRHALGDLLLAAGVPIKTIQRVLRHTRLATTADIYTELFDEARRAAAEQVNGVLVDLQAFREEHAERKTG